MKDVKDRLIQQAHLMLELHQTLLGKGLKSKDIAKALSIYPSAYSSLINKVLPQIKQLRPPVSDETIHQIFATVNNVSATRTRKKLPVFIDQLEELCQQSVQARSQNRRSYVDTLIHNSPARIMKLLKGTYACYYLSSFGYRIKREPLMISYSPINQSFLIRKGNNHSPAQYEGMGYVSNNHLFTIQLQEAHILTPDNFVAHFHLPPSYSDSLNMLKGIAISMSNSYLPISRKVILHRLSGSTKMSEYEQLETTFFQEDEGKEEGIIQYLRDGASFMEYVPIPHPNYDVSDLQKEQQVVRLV